MKYIIKRTSGYIDENPRVKGVQKEILPYIWGYQEPKEELREAYTIEIDSMEVLQNLIKECGDSIIVSGPTKDGFRLPEIEIYDSYRE